MGAEGKKKARKEIAFAGPGSSGGFIQGGG
jgi:hypothetical protein